MNITLSTPWYRKAIFGLSEAAPTRMLDVIAARFKEFSKGSRRKAPKNLRPTKRPSGKQEITISIEALVEAAERMLKSDALEQAEKGFRAAIEAISRTGEDVPLMSLRAFAGLAHCMDEQNQREKAIHYYEKAHGLIQSHGVGLNWTTASCVLNNLSILYRGMNRFGEAESCLITGINELEHTLRVPGSEAVLTTLYEALANLYHLSGHGEAAQEMQKKAAAMQEKGLGVSPERRFESLRTLAQLRLSSGQSKEAVQTFKMALQSLEDIAEPDNKLVVEVLLGLGLALAECSQHSEAVQPLKQALLILEKDSRTEELVRAHVLSVLGNVFMTLGNPTDAYSVFLEANRIAQDSMVAEDTFRLETVANLASACECLGRLSESSALRDQSVELGEAAVRDIHDKVRAVVLPVLKNGNKPKIADTMVAPPIARIVGGKPKPGEKANRPLPLRTDTIDMETLLNEDILALASAPSQPSKVIATHKMDGRSWRNNPSSRSRACVAEKAALPA